MKKAYKTAGAPAPIGPYSQAILSGSFLFTAGQIGLDPSSGELVKSGIAAETEMVMKNIGAILKSAGMDFGNVVKCSIFLTDMGNFAEVNKVYATCFEQPYPVRETVEVSRLPKDASVEISVVAAV